MGFGYEGNTKHILSSKHHMCAYELCHAKKRYCIYLWGKWKYILLVDSSSSRTRFFIPPCHHLPLILALSPFPHYYHYQSKEDHDLDNATNYFYYNRSRLIALAIRFLSPILTLGTLPSIIL